MLSVQVEDAMLDAYDLLYDRAVRSLSSTPRQQLLAIQDTVSVGCPGGGLPLAGRLQDIQLPRVDRNPENGYGVASPQSQLASGQMLSRGPRTQATDTLSVVGRGHEDLLSSPSDLGRAGCLIWGPRQNEKFSCPKLIKNFRSVTAQHEARPRGHRVIAREAGGRRLWRQQAVDSYGPSFYGEAVGLGGPGCPVPATPLTQPVALASRGSAAGRPRRWPPILFPRLPTLQTRHSYVLAVPVLWQELSFQPPGGRGGQPVSGRAGSQTGEEERPGPCTVPPRASPKPQLPAAGLLEAAVRAGLGPGLRSFAPSPPHAAPAWGSPRPGLPSEASRSAGGWKADIGLEGAPREGAGRTFHGREREGPWQAEAGKSPLPLGLARRGAWHLLQLPHQPSPTHPPSPLPAPLPRCPGNKPTPISGREAPGHPPTTGQEDANGSRPSKGGSQPAPGPRGRRAQEG